jgi:glycosyltransferase involved in cell wall biosynthesis
LSNDGQLRVLQLISSSATSGAERHVSSLSNLLQQNDHHVQVVTPGGGWLPGALRSSGIPVMESRMKGFGWLQTMTGLVREIRRNDIQLVHTHLTRAAYIGHALGLLTRVPIVTSVHIANNDQIYRRLAHRNNRLVAVSNYVAGMLRGNGIPERFVRTVYNGTDFIDFAPADRNEVLNGLGIPTDRKVIGLVGKVCRDKGQLELISAMKQVRQDHPDAHVLFVGKVEESVEAEVNAAIDDSGLRSHATLTGVRHDIPSLLDAMTISTLPSVMETFGVAAIEAMARRRAVVATRIGALPEVVQHKQTGLLVDLRPSSIAEAIHYLLENEDERERMGRTGQNVVRQMFTLTEMVKRFEAVYRDVLN